MNIMLDTIDKDYLYNHITQEQIFCKFLNIQSIDFKKKYINPLRVDDDKAGCSFYYSQSGILYLNDWSWKHFDCIAFVQQMYNLNYHRTCELIAKEFNLIYGNKLNILLEKKQKINIKIDLKVLKKKINKKELEFWTKFDNTITVEELEKYKIYSLKNAWLNGKQIYFNTDEICFYYHLQQGYNYQLYNPNKFYNGVTKFIQATTDIIIGEYCIDYNCDYLLIGKSYKCWFLQKRLNINVISIMSENILISKKNIDVIQSIKFEKTGKYFKLFTLFDNDKTGIKLSEKYKIEHNTTSLIFPKHMEKDFSDNLLKLGVDKMNKLIKTIKYKNKCD